MRKSSAETTQFDSGSSHLVGAPLGITIQHEPGRDVCSLSGDLDASSARRLRNVLSTRMEVESDCVIDLGAVSFIDSSGLGVLVGALKRYESTGHKVVLRSPSSSLRGVLDTTGLTSVFSIEA